MRTLAIVLLLVAGCGQRGLDTPDMTKADDVQAVDMARAVDMAKPSDLEEAPDMGRVCFTVACAAGASCVEHLRADGTVLYKACEQPEPCPATCCGGVDAGTQTTCLAYGSCGSLVCD